MSECNQDCSSCKEHCSDRSQSPHDFREQPNPLSRIGHVIGIVSGKGGVGKSMVTSLLAVLMRRRGFRVGVLDADITGPSIPKTFGLNTKARADEAGIYPVQTKTGIEVMSVNLLLERDSDPVLWRGPMIAGVVKQFWTDVLWNDVDFLFVDLPPGTGDVPLTVFQALPVEGIVVVTSPQELVSMVVEKALKMAEQMEVPVLGLVENMSYLVCPDCEKRLYLFGESHAPEIAERHGLPLLAQLPVSPELARQVDAGVLELFEGDWLDEAATRLEALAKPDK